MDLVYGVKRTETRPEYLAPVAESAWGKANVARITWFHSDSSPHRPHTEVRILWDKAALWVRFSVKDRYVRCIRTGFQEHVSDDSCCEFFFEPTSGKTGPKESDWPKKEKSNIVPKENQATTGYFNIEINAIGTLLAYFITDPRRDAEGFANYKVLNEEVDRDIVRHTTLDGIVDPEITSVVTYEVVYRLPFKVIQHYSTAPPPTIGSRWRGNLFKCSENSSHPHWGAWSPIGDELNFHQPSRFGVFEFL